MEREASTMLDCNRVDAFSLLRLALWVPCD